MACEPNLQGAIDDANAKRRSGHELAAVVEATCTKGYEAAEKMTEAQAGAEVARLDALGCNHALQSLTTMSQAHAKLVALLQARKTGECEPTIARDVAARCSLPDASVKLSAAQVELEAAVRRLEEQR